MSQLVSKQQKMSEFRTDLQKWHGHMAQALPSTITPERMSRLILTAFQRTPTLLDCEKGSIYGAVMQAASLGLEIDCAGQCWLVPYGNKAQLLIGYQGLVQLVYNSGLVTSIDAECIYEHDQFQYVKGTEEKIVHRPYWLTGSGRSEPGALNGAYAIARMKDGSMRIKVMGRREIERHKASAQASSTGPWKTHEPEMFMKTVVRVLCKLLPKATAPQLARAVELDEKVEAGVDQALDVEFSVEPEPEPEPVKPEKQKGRRKAAKNGDEGTIGPMGARALFALAKELHGDSHQRAVVSVCGDMGYKVAARVKEGHRAQIEEGIRQWKAPHPAGNEADAGPGGEAGHDRSE